MSVWKQKLGLASWWAKRGNWIAASFLALAVIFTFWNYAGSNTDRRRASAQTSAILSLERLLSIARDIETSGRGYALVGTDSYLEPFRTATASLNGEREEARRLWAESEGADDEVVPVFNALDRKVDFTERTIAARREQGTEAAAALVAAGEGKGLMDALRERVADLQEQAEHRRVAITTFDTQRSVVLTALSLVSTILACAMFAWLAWHRRRLVQRSERELSGLGDRFRTLADNIPQLTWMADTEGRIYWYNKRWYDYTGTTQSDMESDGWKKVHDPDRIVEISARFMDAIERGVPWQDTFPLRGKDGDYRWFLSMAQPIRDAHGTILRWFGTNTDVTEQREQEIELEAARDAAEEANHAKSQFLANMSHELRTPLSAVIGYSEMLEEEVEELGEKHLLADLGKIKSNARHLLSVINDVLDISKIEANKVEIFAEVFDVAEMVREVASTVGGLVESKGNTLDLRMADDLGSMHSDVVKIRQVLINLLSNAAKFTENGRITLGVSRASDIVTFTVSDTGLGMTEEQLGRLFERFAQADASTTRRFGGTGLGLAITKAFTTMLGGEVSASSRPGLGSTFSVSIPAEIPAPVAEEAVEETRGRGEEDVVLVIDDDPATRELLSRFLGREGFAVRVAADGRAGLALAETLKPQIILLDVTMPRMDGWEVLRSLKADPRLAAIPVVMCTVIDEKHLGFSLGASDYLLKPVDWEHLKEVIARVAPQAPLGDVLVVDDDADTRTRLETLLSKDGWTVSEAENGRMALDKVRQHTPTLVLLDLNMPEMDGFTFLREFRLKPETADVPVIVMTARDLSAAERAELKGNAARVIEKGSVGMNDLAAQLKAFKVAPALLDAVRAEAAKGAASGTTG